MKLLKLIGAIVTIVGSILLGLSGVLDLINVEITEWLLGLTYLVLGIGLTLYVIPFIVKKP